MRTRQSLPREWLIIAEQPSRELWRSVRRLHSGTGILVLTELSASERRHLRHIARSRRLTLVDEGSGDAARVHAIGDLRAALLRRTPLILLSPIYPTHTHPEWRPLRRMRAAALARLGRRNLFALGGMNARRFMRVRPLGFQGWAGISAFRI